MNTLTYPTKIGNATNLKKMILQELHNIETLAEPLRQVLNHLGGLGDLRELEAKTVRKASGKRATPKRGAPSQLLEALKSVDGNFTVDGAMEAARKGELDYSRTDVMNYIQALLKRGNVKIIESGRGRHVAIYALGKLSSKSLKPEKGEAAATQ